ncbi:hypothetical protein AB0E56_09390 [Microbacterium sp. NPDC028030]|uniref:hypothetical protein n=1 Tax=Microbacterium sp. NPDC028030 TaxID=3155124 RepID=UPI0033DADA05
MTRRVRSIRVPGAVRGITLRLLLVAVVGVGAAVLVPFPLWQGVALLAAVVSVIIPRSLAAWASAACLVFGVLLTEPAPGRTAVAVLLVHAVHILASLSLAVPMASRLALQALRPTLVRFAVVQALSQPLVFAAWLLAPSGVDRGIAWLAPAAAALLLFGVLLELRAAKRADAGVEAESESPSGADVRGPS